MVSSRRTTAFPWRWTTRLEALVVAFWIAGVSVGAEPPAPANAPASAMTTMTNEDVVRMVAAQLPLEQILRTIRSARTTAFDLDPEIVVELRRAGVPDAAIEAMKESQKAMARSAPAAGATPAAGMGTVELVFEKEGAALQRSTAVSLAKDWKDRPVSLAFFVICLDPLHAPDLWDTRTPLRQAFPRHQVLWFLDRTLPFRQTRRGAILYLDLPDRATFEVEEGAHALRLGVAGRAGDDPWVPIASSGATLTVAAGRTSGLRLRVKTARADRLNLALGSTPSITCDIVRVEQAPAAPFDPKS